MINAVGVIASDLDRYLDVLFGVTRRRMLVEVRWRIDDGGMRRTFIPVAALDGVAALMARTGVERDVFVGVLPRWRRGGRRADVVGDGRTVWVDLDVADGLRAIEPVDPEPALVVASGAPGHLHVYWRLSRALPPREIERANGRLAFALGGDLSSRDAGRILRPPGTVNHVRGTEVRLLHAEDRAVSPGELVGGLEDPPGWLPPRSGPARHSVSRGGVDSVAPEVYVQALTGLRVGRSRKVRCPLHADGTPSLHVYPEVEQGWYCFGCRRGGTVYDLAGHLWSRPTSGPGFVDLRADLERVLIA